MGNTGDANGIHLHFAIRKNGKQVDPKPYLLGEKLLDEEKVNVSYQVYDNKKESWLPIIIDSDGYAGIFNNPIGGIATLLIQNGIIQL